jgi:hypothetical protein
MFGKKIEHGYANHEKADHQRIPVTPFAKQRSSFFVHFLFINRLPRQFIDRLPWQSGVIYAFDWTSAMPPTTR